MPLSTSGCDWTPHHTGRRLARSLPGAALKSEGITCPSDPLVGCLHREVDGQRLCCERSCALERDVDVDPGRSARPDQPGLACAAYQGAWSPCPLYLHYDGRRAGVNQHQLRVESHRPNAVQALPAVGRAWQGHQCDGTGLGLLLAIAPHFGAADATERQADYQGNDQVGSALPPGPNSGGAVPVRVTELRARHIQIDDSMARRHGDRLGVGLAGVWSARPECLDQALADFGPRSSLDTILMSPP